MSGVRDRSGCPFVACLLYICDSKGSIGFYLGVGKVVKIKSCVSSSRGWWLCFLLREILGAFEVQEELQNHYVHIITHGSYMHPQKVTDTGDLKLCKQSYCKHS